jgi:hypothetical protein
VLSETEAEGRRLARYGLALNAVWLLALVGWPLLWLLQL